MNHFLNSFPGTAYEKLSSLMSMPLSTSTTTNEYIDSINSELSFQLAEMTVFQFPNSDQCKLDRIYLTATCPCIHINRAYDNDFSNDFL